MPHQDKLFVVIGGVNVDISGTSQTPIVEGDSNPGKVSVTMGGVGRNIAENLCRMGAKVSMITALGEDANAAAMRENCAGIGIDLSHSLLVPGGRTSTYLCLNDCDGEIAMAVSDMDIYECLTPQFLATKLDVINQAALVILDGNLSKESIDYLSTHCTAPMAADPVSVKKAEKMKDAQGKFVFMKPNRMEASLLTGLEVGLDTLGLARAASMFFKEGMIYVLISLGKAGVYFNDGHDTDILPIKTRQIVNTTGCGDAFMAAACLGFVQGKNLRQMASMGFAASAICSQWVGAVNPHISLEKIEELLQEDTYEY